MKRLLIIAFLVTGCYRPVPVPEPQPVPKFDWRLYNEPAIQVRIIE